MSFHHLKRLVKDGLARLALVDDFDNALGKGQTAAIRVFVYRDSSAKSKLDKDAATEGI